MAVDEQGDVFVAEATAQRVQEVRAGSRTVVTVAGTGTGGFNGDGPTAAVRELDEPTGVAVDAAGDLFIADTANCRVRVVPAVTTTLFGQAVRAGGLFTVAGTGVCGSTGQGGPLHTAQLWNPVAVTLDAAGDLLVADSGDQSVLLAPSGGSGTFYGSAIGAGDIGVVVGGTGSYGPYVADGLPANGPTAELNDPRGLAIGPTGALFVSDGFMHVIRAVPAVNETLLGRTLRAGDLYTVAGAVPATTAAGTNDGMRWVRTQMGTPVGVAASTTGRPVLRRRHPGHGPGDGNGSPDLVSRFGRRTFLASSAGVAAGAAAVGAPLPLSLSLQADDGADAAARSFGTSEATARQHGPLRTTGLTVNGLTNPVGIDPDGCSFAWTLQASGRGAAQHAYRVVVRRTDPGHEELAWDSGPVASARQAFVAYAGPALVADAGFQWTVQSRDAAGKWGPASAPSSFTTGLRESDWRASWLVPSAGSAQPDRVDLPPERGDATRRIAQEGRRLCLGRTHLPLVR